MRIGRTAFVAAVLALLASERGQAATGILDEAKLGLLAHDVPVGGSRQETGVDFNGELLFVSPGFLAPIWAPRPDLGLSINSAGGNSYAFAGLTWLAPITDAFFADLELGGAVHDGPDVSHDPSRKGLGTRALFHESVELGYRWTPARSLALYLDHVSNADLGTHNPGLTNLGLRMGFAF